MTPHLKPFEAAKYPRAALSPLGNTSGKKERAPFFLPLTAADSIPGAKKSAASADQHEQLTRQAERWVSQTFFGTLLKQMHDSPFRSEWLDGGRGGQAFSSLYDQQMADRMARASGKKLVRGIVRQIEGQMRRRPAGGNADTAYGRQERRATGHVPADLRA